MISLTTGPNTHRSPPRRTTTSRCSPFPRAQDMPACALGELTISLETALHLLSYSETFLNSSCFCLFCRWALVKDLEVAKRMTKFIELSTIGVSKDSQLRAAKVLEAVADSCEQAGSSEFSESFFEVSYRLMTERWQHLRDAVNTSGRFGLPEFTPAFCHFHGHNLQPQPGKLAKSTPPK